MAEPMGGIAGILLTHSHGDHSLGVPLHDAPLLLGQVSAAAEDSEANAVERPQELPGRIGPFDVLPTPGHAADHVVFVMGDVCFCGDLVLGQGSSFVPPDGGSLTAYMDSLRAVLALDAELLCPGHGPLITDPRAKVEEYLEHRLDRERKLLAALDDGERSRGSLVAIAWSDVPEVLRPAAAVVMQAHLEKLAKEGRLPDNLVD
jgi:glyoxylase-like metal-dependent hydrolase (beta-lactamase superfamily II)